MMIPVSRRDFLKLSASGALTFVLMELGFDDALAAESSYGRVTWSGIPLYDAPAFNSKKLHLFGKDQIVEILGEVEGDEGNPFNRTWFQVDQGYTYSGWLQPVENNLNGPVYTIPSDRQVGEITVPISLTKLDPYFHAKNGYRLYYGTTHWVKNVVITREEKTIWYEIFDFHLFQSYYVPYYNMRLIPPQELSLISPSIPEQDKLIHLDLSTQLVTAFEQDRMVLSARCSSGGKGTRTPTGEFLTYHKGPSIHMTNQGDAVNNIFDLPGVPWCTFFTGSGNAFHGTYWHNDYGRPRSHGCINLRLEDAKWLYRWSRPNVPPDTSYLHQPGQGTRVQIVSSSSSS